MRTRLASLILFAATATTAGAQCYRFSGSGVTLEVNIVNINFQTGPTVSSAGAQTDYVFSGTNSFTSGGSTLTSISAFDGAVDISYLAPIAGSADVTSFTVSVPNGDPPGAGSHSWTAYLGGVGNLIPSHLLPQALPPISAWTAVGNTNIIQISSGASRIKIPITAVSTCSTSGGGGLPGQTLGDPSSQIGCAICGYPINLGTGNMFEEADDYHTAGPNRLEFLRYYNSMATSPTFAASLGKNWRSNYDRYLNISPTSVIAERPDGQQVTFTSSGGGWTTDADIDLTLTGAGSTWTLTDHQDTVETYTAGSGSEALLQTIQARNGYTQTLLYNASNQLTSVTDSFNRQLTFVYSNGLLQSVTTPDGLVLTYAFTSSGSSSVLTSVGYSTTPASSRTYLYENSLFPGALTGIIDENGARYMTWTYDSSGRALTSQLANGAGLTTIVYNDSDGSRTVTNALGEQELYKFATVQGVPKVIEIDRSASATTAAATSKYTYDSNGYMASHIDWNGNLTTFVNDSRGQAITVNEAAGTSQARTITITYHPVFRLPARIVTPGLTTTFTYDSAGELLTKTLTDTTTSTAPYSTNGQTRTWTYTWSNFLQASIKSPRTDVSSVTNFTYDAGGRVTSVSNALNQTKQIIQHLPGGLPQTIIDPNGVTTNLTYDARQRLLTSTIVTAAGPLTTSYGYDAAGNVLSITQPDGASLTSTYDAAHRLKGVTDNLGNSITYILDAMGDRTQVALLDPGSAQQLKRSAVYDALGRVLESIGGANQITSYTYDSNGNLRSVTDPLNHVTQQSFDALNRLTHSTNSASGITTTSYDSHSRLLSTTDPNGANTTSIYDGFGDLIQEASPAAGTTTYHYDFAGNLTQKIDARGVVANYAYDALDRMISITYPGNAAENVIYSYDQSGHGFGVGRLTSVTDAAGALSRSYDERGNRLSETRTHGSAMLLTSYTYDAASRVISITYPSHWSVAYTRDAVGRITAAAATAPGGGSPQSLVSAVTYQPFGPIKALTYGNGITEARTFDPDYRLTHLTAAGSSPLQNLTYGYDAAGNILTISDGIASGNSQGLGYDTLNRLTSAAGSYGNLAYSYDPNGNRLTGTENPGAVDGLGSVSAFTYNQSGRLATASAGAQLLTQYTYDAFGRRIVKVGSTTATTIFQYDKDGRLLEETDGQGNAQVDYVYLNGLPVATIQPSNSKIYFLHDDRLGTPQMATDGTQAVAWSTTYQPFGQISSPSTVIVQDLRLPGQESDPETGLNHNGFRDYAAALGRYMQSDPIGLAGGLNTYAYVGGNPLGYADPLGLCSLAEAAQEVKSYWNQGVDDAESFAQVQWAEVNAYGVSGYVQQLSWVAAAENAYQQYAPAVHAVNSIRGFLGDVADASEGKFLGIIGVETTLLEVMFGPLPKFDPVTQTFTPAKK